MNEYYDEAYNLYYVWKLSLLFKKFNWYENNFSWSMKAQKKLKIIFISLNVVKYGLLKFMGINIYVHTLLIALLFILTI